MRALAFLLAFAMLAVPASAQWRGSKSTNWNNTGGWTTTKPGGSTVTLDAMPYTRTVACDGYVVSGSYTGPAPTWSASPSGESGGCTTGGGTFACGVVISPDAVGEGVETITISNGGTSQTVTIGFYVGGAHSCFLAQSVDGSYNAGLANLDAITTWVDMGSAQLNVTQPGAATLKPTFRTAIVGGQPVVRCDGGDFVRAATAADWVFLNDGTDFTVESLASTASANPNALNTITATTLTGAAASRGLLVAYDDRAGSSRNDAALAQMSNGTSYQFATAAANDTIKSGVFHALQSVLDEGSGSEWNTYSDGTARITVASVASYSSSNPSSALTICSLGDGTFPFTGDLFRVLIYQSALTSTQRGINKAVDEWAMSGTLPVTPLTIAALPYTRTTAVGSYTLTGTGTSSGAVTWSASPSGASGSCTGTSSWSCVVSVSPDDVTEGVETITVSQSGSSQQVTLGFYAGSPHTVLHAQNVNGSYNSSFPNGSAVATWENVGSSALDLTQGTAGARPTFTTSVVNGQPIVRFDGGDILQAATAADWDFISDGSGATVEIAYRQTTADPNNYQVLLTNQGANSCGVGTGFCAYYEDRVLVGANERNDASIANATVSIGYLTGTNATVLTNKVNLNVITVEDIVGSDMVQLTNGSANGSVAISSAYPSAGSTAIYLGADGSSGYLTGDVWRVFIYDSVASSTIKTINENVDEWALGGTLPVTP